MVIEIGTINLRRPSYDAAKNEPSNIRTSLLSSYRRYVKDMAFYHELQASTCDASGLDIRAGWHRLCKFLHRKPYP